MALGDGIRRNIASVGPSEPTTLPFRLGSALSVPYTVLASKEKIWAQT